MSKKIKMDYPMNLIKHLFVSIFICVVLSNTTSMAQVILVRDGKAYAVVVTADDATATARYAAGELVGHVEKATGVRLETVTESDAPADIHTRVYIGETKTGPHHGIDPGRLPREAFILRSVGNDLFIVGKEDDGDPLDPSNPNAGTLFGVYEFLEEVLKVRWLWPGELGTYVPVATAVEVNAINRLHSPALNFRELVWGPVRGLIHGGKIEEEDALLGFSHDVAHNYAGALSVFLRRHRMGGMDAKPPTGHGFSGWWQRYGREHPEWFSLRRDGTRGDPDPEAVHVDICVTNEELQDFIVEQWDGESVLRLGPVDRPGRCTCEECRSWDGPQPETPPWFAKYVYEADSRASEVFHGATSDRYARFWKTIQEKARERNPHVIVSGSFIYENEFPAPVTGIRLNKNIYAEFVQWQDPHLRWFPMPEEAYEWIKEQWLGWQNTGLRMGYRPNYLHDGYVMPHFETRQSGDFFKWAFEHGMEGARFDSNTGQWAVHGPRLYMHMRLISKPEIEIGEIRDEYFSAFGPAAENVEHYFNYWEDFAFDNVLNFIDMFHNPRVGWRYRAYPLKAHEAFPLEVIEQAEEILDRALEKALTSSKKEYAGRVEFLRIGLDHARLTINLASIFDGNSTVPEGRMEEAGEALRELVKFRKDNQESYFSDLLRVTNYWERPRWDLDNLIKSTMTGE